MVEADVAEADVVDVLATSMPVNCTPDAVELFGVFFFFVKW